MRQLGPVHCLLQKTMRQSRDGFVNQSDHQQPGLGAIRVVSNRIDLNCPAGPMCCSPVICTISAH